MSFDAKSVIFDIANNYGDTSYTGLRSVEFILNEEVISLSTSDFTTYGPYNGNGWQVFRAFDTSLSKTYTGYFRSWLSTSHSGVNPHPFRIIVVFNSSQTFDGMIINNFHEIGGSTSRGLKNVKIYTSPDTITDTTYGNTISNSTLIFDDVFTQHVSSDTADDEVLTLVDPYSTSLKDMATDILVYAEKLADAGIDVSAYYKTLQSGKIDIDVLGLFLNDNKLDVFAAWQEFKHLPLSIHTAMKRAKNIFMDIYVSNGFIHRDIAMDIAIGDGNKTTDMGMDCMVVSTMPEFKSIYAMHLTSAIKEVVS